MNLRRSMLLFLFGTGIAILSAQADNTYHGIRNTKCAADEMEAKTKVLEKISNDKTLCESGVAANQSGGWSCHTGGECPKGKVRCNTQYQCGKTGIPTPSDLGTIRTETATISNPSVIPSMKPSGVPTMRPMAIAPSPVAMPNPAAMPTPITTPSTTMIPNPTAVATPITTPSTTMIPNPAAATTPSNSAQPTTSNPNPMPSPDPNAVVSSGMPGEPSPVPGYQPRPKWTFRRPSPAPSTP